MSKKITRKQALKNLALGTAALSVGTGMNPNVRSELRTLPLKGNINHSVCQWCYSDIPLEQLAEGGREIGLKSIELLYKEQWPVVQKYGLTCAMAYASDLGLERGFSDINLHAELQRDYISTLPLAEAAGLTKIICFSGKANGLSQEQGLENCAVGLEPVVNEARKYGITICMELLNSKLDHPDYQCDHTPWGVQLVDKIGSEYFRLLYDIYHMQIMEGDIIATIRKYKDYLVHFHTGGVPGRNEIDETQELNYPAIMKALVDMDFKGYVAQEFIPTNPDKLASLKQGVEICDV